MCVCVCAGVRVDGWVCIYVGVHCLIKAMNIPILFLQDLHIKHIKI